MSIQAKSQTIEMANGKTITIETGKLAKQADGSVVVKQGGTMILATVVSSTELRDGIDFFPLSVDYKEKYTAAGSFPGGYLKREARPSETEILICRLVDRALRPLFADDYRLETQVMLQLISYDENASTPESLAGLAASAAIAVSDIPFLGPVSEAQVARVNGEFIVNPTKAEVAAADMDMIIAATMDNIMMVEGEMSEVSEEEMIEAIKVAHEAIKIQCQAQLDLAAQVEKAQTKRTYVAPASNPEVYASVKTATYDKLYAIASKGSSKQERTASFNAVYEELLATYSEEDRVELKDFISTGFKKAQKAAVRDCVLNEGVRLDGRTPETIRPIWTEVNYLPGSHGSGIFTRGETQALTSLAIGTKLDAQKSDGVSVQREDKFYLHYNFPPFSTGEARPVRGVSRREIGHGNLAWRGLKPVVPTGDDFPYTIRINSDILESNGSSSMASVCAGTLALMDAGIPITAAVSGIAMGLIYDQETGKFAVLSDILGDEDHLGDMDFKVTGTEKGITAAQMDIKIDGLSYEVLVKALYQAKEGRLHILGEMAKTISKPNADFKDHAPRIIGFTISSEFMGAIIGPGGKVIQELQKETGTTIVLEEKDSKICSVAVAGSEKAGIDKAVAFIKGISTMPEAGAVYTGKVKVILDFGAIIEFLPGKEGLLHISEIAHKRIKDVKDELTEGQQVEIKILEIDKRSGKFKLSRKALLPKPERSEEPKQEA